MQGYDADVMTQEDIDKSIEYLFPSGLATGKYFNHLCDHCNPFLFYCRGKACYETTGGDFSQAERCRV